MGNAMKQTIVKNSQVPFYEIPVLADGGYVRTFARKTFQVKGIIARDIETNEVVKISSIYYQIRTVRDKNRQTVAKRKNPNDELKRVLYKMW